MQYSLCNAWEFTETCTEAFLRGEPVETESVRLPHTCREVPLHYASPGDYEMVCGYRRRFTVPGDAPRLFLRFDGAAHQTVVFVNGKRAGSTGAVIRRLPWRLPIWWTGIRRTCSLFVWTPGRIPRCRPSAL